MPTICSSVLPRSTSGVRQDDCRWIQRRRIHLVRRMFVIMCQTRTWNSLLSSLQQLNNSKTFRCKLKTFLFQQAYDQTIRLAIICKVVASRFWKK